MQIRVDRYISDTETTLSRLWLGSEHLCYGLEDEYREEKTVGETRIPAGEYPVRLRTEGGFHQRYQQRFPEFHEGMLHIVDIPNFEHVLIHIGNDEGDTSGCLLVGVAPSIGAEGMTLSQSEVAYRRLYPALVSAAKHGELSIVFEDNDKHDHPNNNLPQRSHDMADKKHWRDRLKAFAPAALTALTNPAAGGAMALKVIAGKLGVAEDESQIQAAVDRMEDADLQLKLKGLDLEFYKASLDAELQLVSAEERIQLGAYEVAKVEAASNDQYVRRTRPMIARWSFYAGAAYSLVAELIQILAIVNKSPDVNPAFTKPDHMEAYSTVITAIGTSLGNSGADPMVAAALFAPCMAYIGARTFDKAKPFNK